MRMLHKALLTYMCGQQKDWSGWESQCGGACIRGDMQRICMRKDGLASGFSFSGDLTVINFGHHFCDGERRKTFKQYQLQVDNIAKRIKSMSPEQRNKVVWHETNMMPLRKDLWIRGYGDQRTNIKLAAYNMYATGKMKKLGIPIIPAFAQTLPLFSGSVDDAHIPVEYLSVSSLAFVLSLACPDKRSKS